MPFSVPVTATGVRPFPINRNGAAPTAAKCPLTKCAVSVTANAYDGQSGSAGFKKLSDLQAFAETNWSPAHVYRQPSVFWDTIYTGPWDSTLPAAPSGIGKPTDFTTMFEGQCLGITYGFITGGWNPDIRVWIDDEEIVDWYKGTRAGGVLQGKSPINSVSDLAIGTVVLNLNFARRGVYKIRVHGILNTVGGASAEDATSGSFLVYNNAEVPILIKPRAKPNVGVISDSFFEPIIGQTTATLAGELGHQLGVNIHNLARGGSGFVNPGAGPGDRSFPSDLVFQALGRVPPLDGLIVNGSSNDLAYTDGQVQTAVRAFFSRIRKYDPTLPIIWVGCEPQSYFTNMYGLPYIQARENLLKAEAALQPQVVRFVPTANEPWLYGTGNTASPNGTGNQDFLVGADGIHLSSAGVRFYGRMIAERIRNQ